ncbi:hypothetical protein PSHT_01824 [Puccinia striiformis]|uniref:Uncharacterized protein n=2 Tax=Puccinia striiformis TaxID=27350 RepID=A0A2S4WJD8_9BASI|nr:hypothetical protein PSHT_01824 [Puccinia striiformis]
MVTRNFGPNQTPYNNEPANVGNDPTTGTASDRNPTAATNGEENLGLEDMNATSTHTVLHPRFDFATGTQPPPTGQAEEVEVVQLTLSLDNNKDADDAIGSQEVEESIPEPEPEPQWIDIHINYTFHVVQAANNQANNPRAPKQKAKTASTQDDLPKTMKLAVKDNKIVVPEALNNFDLACSKRETIAAIRQNINEWLAHHAEELEDHGAIKWQVAIKNGRAASRLPKGKMKTCTLVQLDSKVVAQNKMAFKQLKAHHTPNNNPGKPSREPTAGASLSVALHNRMREIYAAHDPCE